MSYARWGHDSEWYGYWSSMSGNDKASKVLSLSLSRGPDVRNLSYEDIEEWTVFDVMNNYSVDEISANKAMEIINSFKEDVISEYVE